MRKTCVSGVMMFLGLLVSATPAYSALIDNDTFTTDTRTGLDWLDLTQTTSLSYDDVESRMALNGGLTGWRHASRAEVAVFWESAGGVGPFSGSALGEVDWVRSLQRLWGITYPFVYSSADGAASYETSVAMTSEHSLSCLDCNLTVYIANNWLVSDSSQGDIAESQQLNEARRWQGQRPVGHALVRDSSFVGGGTLPEPTTPLLVSLALACLARSRLRF